LAKKLELNFQMRQEIFLFYKASRASLVPTQPHIEYGGSFTKGRMEEE
jgi:hypothetical protein